MCEACWVKAGSPFVDNERVRAAVPLVEAVYEESSLGGGMHIQLDDTNLGDEFFGADSEGRLRTGAERDCFAAFKALSEEERWSVLAIRDGWAGGAGQEGGR